MRLRQTNSMIQFMCFCVFAAAAWAIASSANAAGPAESAASEPAGISPHEEYMVKEGDSLGAIAVSHGVTIREVMEVNRLENPDRINAGDKLLIPTAQPKNGAAKKKGVRISVPKGITLSRIAEIYEIPVPRIVRANGLENPDHLRAGQKLFIPGATEVLELVPPPPCFKPAVELFRLHNQESETVSLCYCDGRPNPEAVDALSRISAPLRKEMPFPLHPHLVQLLQKVAERFPGRRIEIVSGQRLRKSPGHESYHNKGQALDFRVAGVSNRQLSEFARGLQNVGVGYYPNSVFIHMDTREEDAYWIDYSRPGEKAIYGRAGMTDEEVEEIRSKRIAKACQTTIDHAASSDDAQAEVESTTDSEVEIDTASIADAVVAAVVQMPDL